MRRPSLFLFSFLFLVVPAARGEKPFVELGGTLPRTLEAAKGPYLIVADISVPQGRVVEIEKGTVLLFKNFTGLHVEGRLVAAGSGKQPVIFTSEFDRTYNPTSQLIANPYDWNGIYIHGNAFGTSLSHCTITYSVYGIISDTKFIGISPGRFRANGKSNLVIKGDEIRVPEGEEYTYALSLNDAVVDGVPVNILRDPAAPRRMTLRYSGMILLVGGIGTGVYSSLQWRKYQKELDYLSSREQSSLIEYAVTERTGADRATIVGERDRGRLGTVIGTGCTLLGITGLSWSFSF